MVKDISSLVPKRIGESNRSRRDLGVLLKTHSRLIDLLKATSIILDVLQILEQLLDLANESSRIQEACMDLLILAISINGLSEIGDINGEVSETILQLQDRISRGGKLSLRILHLGGETGGATSKLTEVLAEILGGGRHCVVGVWGMMNVARVRIKSKVFELEERWISEGKSLVELGERKALAAWWSSVQGDGELVFDQSEVEK